MLLGKTLERKSFNCFKNDRILNAERLSSQSVFWEESLSPQHLFFQFGVGLLSAPAAEPKDKSEESITRRAEPSWVSRLPPFS